MLKIINPATGAQISEIPEATEAIVAERAQAARAAQPAWAARALAERLDIMQNFRVALAAEVETLATTLTTEVGKPIRQSRNEINGLLGRIDFFITEAEKTIGTEQV